MYLRTSHLGLSALRASGMILLTKCSLEPVSFVLVDPIPAEQVHGTDATCEAGVAVAEWPVVKQTKIQRI